MTEPLHPANAPIVDAHVHLWDAPQFPRPWLGAFPTLNRSFGVEEYQDQTGGLPIAEMVYVETGVASSYTLLEAQWAVAQARTEPRLRGVVAAAPLDDGLQVRAYLDALTAMGPLVKGVRRNLEGEHDPDVCLRDDFVQGVRLLAEYGFSCDICIRHDQLSEITALVQQCPDVSFVLDHLGKPPIKEGRLDPWRDQLAALATLPNIVCKLSGLVTEADWSHWQPANLAPYVLHAAEVFGPERLLFGSDWPVVTLASAYWRWVETLDALTIHLSPDHRRNLWGENARRCYRL